MPNVSLGPHFERFVQEQLTGGRYQNASEVVRAGLRLLEDFEASRSERLATIRDQLAAAAANPQRLTAEEVSESLNELDREIAGLRGDAA
ncbi:antitoxin ParD1/3/4 [Inquilinus ginsengisoli]|uniref:type II toxin-antitoxin system ParD family antitoxin n=1 Tax=Inquilinus ginsengisoli TaxID=363840 RepID=UPI003D1A16EF